MTIPLQRAFTYRGYIVEPTLYAGHRLAPPIQFHHPELDDPPVLRTACSVEEAKDEIDEDIRCRPRWRCETCKGDARTCHCVE